MEQFHVVNTYVCFVCGTALNSLLLWIIRLKTPEEMRPYSRILSQTAVLDLGFLVVNLLYHPVVVVRGEGQLTYGVGLLAMETSSSGNRLLNVSLFALWAYAISLVIYSMPVQFYYRYKVLSGEEEGSVSMRSYIHYMLASVACSAIVALLYVLSLEPIQPQCNRTSLAAYNDQEIHFAIHYTSQYGIRSVVSIVVGMGLMIAAYTVIGWYNTRTWLHIRQTQELLPVDSPLRAMNRQLNAMLIMLALGPFLISFLPTIVLMLYILITVGSGGASTVVNPQDLTTDSINLQPIFNAIAALIIIKPYRRVIAKGIRWCMPCCSSQDSEETMPQNSVSLASTQIEVLKSTECSAARSATAKAPAPNAIPMGSHIQEIAQSNL